MPQILTRLVGPAPRLILVALSMAGATALIGKTTPVLGATQHGQLRFTNITAAAGLASDVTGSHGVFWADATGDGLPDLFLTYNECRSGTRRNRFYRNTGGAFVEEAGRAGLAAVSGGSHGGAWVDLDNDGDYDLLNGRTYASPCLDGLPPPPIANQVFENDGGTFRDITPAGMAGYADYTRDMLGVDFDGDGDIDIFAVNGDKGSEEAVPDRNELYRNDGGLRFTAITTGPVVTTPAGQGGAETDYDGDGDLDLFLPNYTGDLGVLRNDGGGAFTVVPPASIGIYHRATTGISSGDLDGDGRIDLVLVDQDRDPARRLGFDRAAYVYLNVGGGTFRFAGEMPSGRFGGYTAGLADLDNDGDLDMTLPGLPYVLLNDGHAGFSPGPAYPGPQPAAGCVRNDCTVPDPRTVAFADIDDDGDMDSVVSAKFGTPALIRNDFDGGQWLKIRLVSPEGQAGAFGAKVRVTRPGTSALIALREAKSGFGYLSQSEPVVHVGLGSATAVDVEVTFLDGLTATAANVPANRTIIVTGHGVMAPPDAPPALRSSVAGSVVSFSWDAPAGAVSGYRVEAGSARGASDLAVFTLDNQTTLAASAPDGVYYTRVRALNGPAVGPPSPEAVVTVGAGCAPGAPRALGFTLSGASVTLRWSAPAGGAAPTGYVVEAGSSPGASDLAALGTAATRVTVGAPPGRYHVRVRATSGCGTGPASNEVIIAVP